MDGCRNDILAPIILAVMATNGRPLTLDDIVDGVTEVITSQYEYSDNAIDFKAPEKSCKRGKRS
ncbi:hypothetical protein KR018_007714, partial [Drosophila ironensis]